MTLSYHIFFQRKFFPLHFNINDNTGLKKISYSKSCKNVYLFSLQAAYSLNHYVCHISSGATMVSIYCLLEFFSHVYYYYLYEFMSWHELF